MAPGEVKVNAFPDTLPEDFAEWDGGGAQPTVVAPVKQASATSARPAETRPPATARVVAPDREIERSMPQPVVRAPKPVPPPAAKAAVEQTWQPAPRARQQSAPAKPDFAPPSTQRNAEAKLAEALWPEAEQKKKAKAESGTRGHRTVAVAVGVVVLCAGLGAGGYMMYIWRSHAQQHPQTATDTHSQCFAAWDVARRETRSAERHGRDRKYACVRLGAKAGCSRLAVGYAAIGCRYHGVANCAAAECSSQRRHVAIHRRAQHPAQSAGGKRSGASQSRCVSHGRRELRRQSDV